MALNISEEGDKIRRAMNISLLTLALTVFSTVSAGARPYALGDLNADNKVDFTDLHLFSLQWLDYSGCFGYSCANLNDVNGVDMADFALLAANWQDIRIHLVISELMARNSTTLLDGDGQSSDWLEIYNPTDTAVILDGWYLTDSSANLTMWQFPDGLKIEPGDFLIVFASGKTYELYPHNYPYLDSADYYHTNFNLDKEPGEYLALVASDGKTIVHEYTPEYPLQLPDISYGLPQHATNLVPIGATASYYVPTSSDSVLGTDWTVVDFDDSAWRIGKTTIGFGGAGGEGTILREYWTGIGGSTVPDLTGSSNYPDNPTGSDEQALFEAPSGWGDDYGTRMHGFLHPPTSGDYTFWIASDDSSELWLSTDSNPANKSLIAYVSGWTNSREWSKYAQQQSSSINLEAGQKYYIQSLHKEAGGGDNLAVTWEGPGIISGNPIEGRYLSPWTGSWIATDIEEEMQGVNSSLWIRIEFQLEEGQAATFDTLTLRMKYEDGFVAYINGQEVVSRNAPNSIYWDSAALSDRPDANASVTEVINLTAFLSTLQNGMNVLSIHGLNNHKDNGDFLILPELVAARNEEVPQYFTTATPGTFNVSGGIGVVDEVWFSHKRGFYDAPFQLKLYTADDDAEIRYTTDGTRPTITHGNIYNLSIPINETTMIRAVAVKPGYLDSAVETHTYLLNASATIKALPVVSLVGDTEETFYEPNGVMAIVGGYYSGGVWTPDGPNSYNNPMQRGMDFERSVSFEMLYPDDNSSLQEDCGIRVHGSNWMRPRYTRCDGLWSGNCKFSFRLYFRSQYGENRLEYPLFPFEVERFKSIVLRGGHNDRTNPFIKDELLRRLYMDMGQVSSGGIMANLFINGEYKGYFNPCEHIKKQHCQEWYNSDKEWDVMTMNGIRDGDTVSWNAMLNAARNYDLTEDAHYQEVGRRLDIPAFIDYLILQLWSGNWDWPQNNWSAACERSEEGRWRFFIWDAEGGMFSNRLNTVYLDRLNSQNNANGYLYRALKVNVNFRQLFADRVYKHFFHNGAMTNAHIEKRFYELRDEMSGVLPNMSTYVVDTWTPQRWAVIYNAFVQEGIYFTVEAPEFYINGSPKHGGEILSDDKLTMVNPNGYGTLYYTTDGNDPRLPESMQVIITTLVTEDASKLVLVPTGPVDPNWYINPAFDDTDWNDGTFISGKTGGVGYDNNPDYLPYISYDVRALMSANNSCYIRIPFTFNSDPCNFNLMTLKIRYDDGFVAYLNGDEIERKNFTGTPVWNSNASGGHEAVALESIPVSDHLSSLKQGNNILAIHGLNTSTTSSDFLISAELIAGEANSTGGISPGAIEYTGQQITFNKSSHVKARVLDGITWSPLNEAIFAVGPIADNLRITEVMYHPQNTGDPNDPNTEFIELKNIGPNTVNLNLARFTEGIKFTFPDMELDPDEYVLVVKNQSEFEAKYGTGIKIAGEYVGSLANDGERIKLEDANGRMILDFKYKDDWYSITDGDGFSLTVIEPGYSALYGSNKGLLAHWKFDDGSGNTATDSAGTNNGILNGDPAWTAGRIDGALYFDGVDDYVSFNPVTPLIGNTVTVQAWICTSEFAGIWNPVIMQHDMNTTNDGYYFYVSSSRPSFYIVAGSSYAQAISPEVINANQWYHIAGTNDGSLLKLYVDGRLKDSDPSTGYSGINNNAFIGYEPTSQLYYNGLIDDVRIYNRSIIESEFQDMADPMGRWSRKSSWRSSVYRNGTPGWDDSGILPDPGSVVINEVMAHSNAGPDWIELHNTTDGAINIGGWFLSDNDRDEPNLTKYRIADGTTIGGNDYVVFYQDTDFNNPGDPGCLVPFALSENG
ncbi:MAG: hypothetical protein GWN67_15330, partial [Phycisphaerae bacterium]|nr:hypothetical protein [Phycisphaerae bacterium]NIR64365.1 hypothetical protein [candidate division Zixibacteria bacterium]NIP53494.1 hypothetical protein [Phycisphaerae bacterium]NIS52452.1 hypothetical protein [Phycisphaerae bacterium]NIU10517.1 hypothetical protein [Phycisphaerae bacterium]